MYNEHISQPSAASAPKPLSIRLNALPFNEDAAFVESVCATLIESRFGPGSIVPLNYRLREQPELETAFLDDDDEMKCEYTAPIRVTPLDPKIIHSIVNAVRLLTPQFEHACTAVHFQNLSPPNQGRGSP